MSPDSGMTRDFVLGHTKVGDTTNYGLKRYYLNKFMYDVKHINHLELVSVNH